MFQPSVSKLTQSIAYNTHNQIQNENSQHADFCWTFHRAQVAKSSMRQLLMQNIILIRLLSCILASTALHKHTNIFHQLICRNEIKTNYVQKGKGRESKQCGNKLYLKL